MPHVLASRCLILLLILVTACGDDAPTRSSMVLPSIRAKFTISSASGPPGMDFQVDASSSSSAPGATLKFRWDWEDDGAWDTGFSDSPSASHVYAALGYKSIRLEVKDATGLSATATSEVHITVASREMVVIPAGEFVMGNPEGVGNEDEHPQHTVYLDAYLIGKYEVTNEQYAEFLNVLGRNQDDQGHQLVSLDVARIRFRNGRYEPAKEQNDHPVVGVSWYGASAYAAWVGGRLPTEAEWEKAARGPDALAWPWGEIWEPTNCNTWEAGPHRPTPVGNYPGGVSPYEVYDLAGNVYEWVSDWYQTDYYQVSPAQNPKGPELGQFHILRGGSWAELKELSRPTVRLGQPPESTNTDFGFRVADNMVQ